MRFPSRIIKPFLLLTVLSCSLLIILLFFPLPASYPTTNVLTDNIHRKSTFNPGLNTHEEAKNVYGDPELIKYKDYFIPRNTRITPVDFRFMITADSVCKNNPSPTLMVIVMSMPQMAKQRQAIRDTWGSVAAGHLWPGRVLNGSLNLVFMFGNNNNVKDNRDLQKEAARTGDIVQADFKESYFNLTYKVLMGYKWLSMFCPSAEYVMKVDEDTFFNVPYILNLVKTRKWNNTIYGPFFYKEGVSREQKYRVSPTAYPPKTYPPHVKGNLYLMPCPLAMRILSVAEYMPYVNMEDCHITGILAKVVDARHEGIAKNMYNLRSPAKLCDLALEKKMISQQIFGLDFHRIWERLSNNDLCSHGKYI